MRSYYFANYRLLTDLDPDQWAYCSFLKDFASPMPFQHTLTLRCRIEKEMPPLLAEYSRFPLLASPNRYTLHKTPDGYAFLRSNGVFDMRAILLANQDYGDMTLHIEHRSIYVEVLQSYVAPRLPFSSIIRSCCEAAIINRSGIPMHAALVANAGQGVIFLGPSGTGKSTQAKLWQAHLDADFISGDRPCLRFWDNHWYAFGMPWDGKDRLYRQRGVPVKAVVMLEQAKENSIRRISPAEAKIALFHQAIIPAWDDRALNGLMPLLAQLSAEVPFYHLNCLPDNAAADLTYQTIFNKDEAR